MYNILILLNWGGGGRDVKLPHGRPRVRFPVDAIFLVNVQIGFNMNHTMQQSIKYTN